MVTALPGVPRAGSSFACGELLGFGVLGPGVGPVPGGTGVVPGPGLGTLPGGVVLPGLGVFGVPGLFGVLGLLGLLGLLGVPMFPGRTGVAWIVGRWGVVVIVVVLATVVVPAFAAVVSGKGDAAGNETDCAKDAERCQCRLFGTEGLAGGDFFSQYVFWRGGDGVAEQAAIGLGAD